jgi:hypothetical protein
LNFRRCGFLCHWQSIRSMPRTQSLPRRPAKYSIFRHLDYEPHALGQPWLGADCIIDALSIRLD